MAPHRRHADLERDGRRLVYEDHTLDGQLRSVLTDRIAAGTAPISVVLNWTELLRAPRSQAR